MYELVNRSFCDLSRSCRLSVYIGGCGYNLAFHFKKYRVTTSQNFIYFFLYTGDFHGFSLLKALKKHFQLFIAKSTIYIPANYLFKLPFHHFFYCKGNTYNPLRGGLAVKILSNTLCSQSPYFIVDSTS